MQTVLDIEERVACATVQIPQHGLHVYVLPTSASEVGEGMVAVIPGAAAGADLGLHPFRSDCGDERKRVGGDPCARLTPSIGP